MDLLSAMPSDLLVRQLQRLVHHDRALTAELLAHISEVDARKLYCAAACSSMFMYCTDILRMSGAQAYKRIRVARLARRYPQILAMCSAGQIHLSTLCLLTPHLTDRNVDDLLRQVSNKSKREVELLLAAMAPSPPVPDTMRKLPRRRRKKHRDSEATELVGLLPGARSQQETAPLQLQGSETPDTGAFDTGEEATATSSPPAPRPRHSKVSPLSGDAYKVEFTAGAALVDKVRQAQELMRHQVPDGDLATVVERALDALLPALRKQRFADFARPRRTVIAATKTAGEDSARRTGQDADDAAADDAGADDAGADVRATPRRDAKPRRPRSRHIPAAVKRQVARRDGYQCTFTDHTGRRCPERGMLEFHHDLPFGKGGGHLVSNTRLVCRAHNLWEAARDYGEAVWSRGRFVEGSDGGDIDGFVPGASCRSRGGLPDKE